MRQNREGHTAGDGQTEAACALWLMGLLSGDRGPWVGGKRRPAALSPDKEGTCVALCGTGYCSGGLVSADPPWQQAGVQPAAAAPAGSGDGSNAISVPAGWRGGRGCPHGWRHRPGRPEALC